MSRKNKIALLLINDWSKEISFKSSITLEKLQKFCQKLCENDKKQPNKISEKEKEEVENALKVLNFLYLI